MIKGDIVEMEIEDMSGEGQGIGKAGGFVVFVPGTVVGDKVKAELTKVKKNYGFASLTEMVEASPYRSDELDCASFDEGCGGCPYGKLEYSQQLKLKERQVREKLQRLAGLEDPAVMPIIGMEEGDNDGSGPFRYRNKAQFPVSTGGIITRKGGIVENLGEPAVGFFQAKSHRIVDCSDCYLQSLPAMAAADALRRFMAEDNITAWDPRWEKGLMRHLIVKTGFSSGEVMVILVINGNGIPNVQKLIEMMDEAIYDVGYSLESVVLSIKKSKGIDTPGGKKAGNGRGGGRSGRNGVQSTGDDNRSILGDKNVVAAGKPVISDSLGSLELEISPASFYQVNPVQMKRLYDKVREYCGFGCPNGLRDLGGADPVSPETEADVGTADSDISTIREGGKPVVLDIYCGVGTIGLYCAYGAEAVVGIESVKDAVIDANRNAVINGIVNARYICGRAEEVLPACIGDSSLPEAGTVDEELAAQIRRADIAILDPPRAGCRPELLEAVAAVGVEKILYVSCDPATLARDVKLLGALGYGFVEGTPVDMFPHTGHVETVVLLSHKKPDSTISVKVEFGEGEGKVPLDNIAKRAEAYKPKERVTYKMIKEYIEAKYGFKVYTAYIAEQVLFFTVSAPPPLDCMIQQLLSMSISIGI